MRLTLHSGPTRSIIAPIAGGLAITAVRTAVLLVTAVTVMTLLVYAGGVLPAIWSRRPPRRRAAHAILQQHSYDRAVKASSGRRSFRMTRPAPIYRQVRYQGHRGSR